MKLIKGQLYTIATGSVFLTAKFQHAVTDNIEKQTLLFFMLQNEPVSIGVNELEVKFGSVSISEYFPLQGGAA